MNLGLSTQMQETVLFEKGYSTCQVPNPYDKSLSKTANDTSVDNYTWDILLENNTYRIFNNTYTVSYNNETFKQFESSDLFEKNPINKNNETKELENLLKAIIQLHNHKMIKNTL